MGQATCTCWGPSDGQVVASDLEGEDTAGRLLAEKVTRAERGRAPGPWQLGRSPQPRPELRGEQVFAGWQGRLRLAHRSGCLPRAVSCFYRVGEADLDSRTRFGSSGGDPWAGWDRGDVRTGSRHFLVPRSSEVGPGLPRWVSRMDAVPWPALTHRANQTPTQSPQAARPAVQHPPVLTPAVRGGGHAWRGEALWVGPAWLVPPQQTTGQKPMLSPECHDSARHPGATACLSCSQDA